MLAGLSSLAVILSSLFSDGSSGIPVELSHTHTHTHTDLSVFRRGELMDKEKETKTQRQNTHNGDILDARFVKQQFNKEKRPR